MSTEIVRARVLEHLGRLRLGRIAEQLDPLLSDAARTEPTYLDFLDSILREEIGAKQRKRVAMGIQIAHFPTVKTIDDFDFKFQPSVDQKLVRELALGRYVANAENVLVFGPPGVGKTHLAIGLGRAAEGGPAAQAREDGQVTPAGRGQKSGRLGVSFPCRLTPNHRLVGRSPPDRARSSGEDCVGDLIPVEAGYSVLFTSATALLGALSKAETEGQLADRLAFYAKPKLLIVDELGYLPFEKRSAHLFFQLVARRYEKGSMLITTNQVVTQWGSVFGDEVLAAAILDRLLHHSFTLMIQGESYRLKQNVGDRGRRAVLSLPALNHEYLGTPENWTAAAPMLRAPPFRLPAEDASNLRWLNVLGPLIGNTDRHFGNVTFYVGPGLMLRLAPAYDMLPMILAPSAEVLVERNFEPQAPRGGTLDVWHGAAR